MSESNAAPHPVVILIGAQMGENIGACARAMLNCGLTEMRLVRPRDGWPNPAAEAMAAGAVSVLNGVTVFDDTPSAVADLQRVYATTARPRGMVKPVVTPRQAAVELRQQAGQGVRTGILFGPENAGLNNDDVALADAIVTAPLNPGFTSLNLAQAVLLLAYEWFQARDTTAPRALGGAEEAIPARKETLEALFRRLSGMLDARGYVRSEDLKETTMRNLRNLLLRIDPSEQDARTLIGVLASLERPVDTGGAAD